MLSRLNELDLCGLFKTEQWSRAGSRVAGAEAVGWSGEDIFVPVGGLEVEVAGVGEEGGTGEDLVLEDLEMT